MRFHYIAFQPDGKVIEGNADGKDQSEILQFLGKRGLRPIKITPIASAFGKTREGFRGGKITVTDKVFLTRYLSLMLKVGTDLFQAIDILIADFDQPAVKKLLIEIRDDLERGQPFHSAFARYPRYFSPVFVNLIKAGESSGNLDKVLEDLNRSLEQENELRGRLRGALVYPILLLVMAIVILTFLVTFALPRIAEVFSGGGFNPPIFSRVVFAVGLFLGKYIWIILGVGIAVFAVLGYVFLKTAPGRRVFGKILDATPLVGKVREKLAFQRFSGTMSSLLKSGLPIIDTLEITADAVGQEKMSNALKRISREGVTRGLTIGDSFKRETVFPAVIVNLVTISEKAGHLDEILKTLSDFYADEIDASVKTLTAFIEPALLFLIGAVVAVIALSIIIPIYQLVGQF